MKKLASLLLAALLLCGLAACGKQDKTIPGAKMILLEQSAAAEGDKDAQVEQYQFAQDGSLVHTIYNLYDEKGNAYPAGEEEIAYQKAAKLDPSEFKDLVKLAGEADFMTLPEQLDTTATEGNFTYITIETDTDRHTAGGLEAGSLGPEGFVKLYNSFITKCTIAGI